MNFLMKNQGVEREKRIIFCKLNIKYDNPFNTDIYDNNKNIYMFIKNA